MKTTVRCGSRLLAALLALLMVVSMIPVMALTTLAAETVAGNAIVTLTPSAPSVAVGGTVDLTIAVSNLPKEGVNGWTVKLTLPEGITIADDSFKPGTVEESIILGGVNKAEATVFGVIAKDSVSNKTANATSDFTIGSVTLRVSAGAARGLARISGEVTEFYYAAAEDPYEVDITGTTVVGTSITVTNAEADPDLFPEEPITVDWVTYNNLWFEKHDSWGRVLMIGFRTDALPEDVTAVNVVEVSRVEVTWADGTKQVLPEFASGASASFAIGDNTIFRAKCDPLPPLGLQEGCKVEFVRKSDDKVLFTGTCDIDCEVYEDPTWMEDEPTPATLSRYLGGDTDWTKYGGEDVLAVKMSGLLDLADVHSNTVTWDVRFDGAPVKNPIRTVIDADDVAEDGTYTAVLYLGVPLPEENGAHTVQVTVSYESDTMYTTEPLTVIYKESLTKVAARAATCEKDGNVEYYTDAEGNLYLDSAGKQPTTLEEVTLPATGHTLTHHEAVPHTCTGDGTIEYWECSVCGKYFRDAEGQTEIADKNVTDPATGHTLTHHEAKEPTETEDGNLEYWSCDVCGKLFLDADAELETTLEEVIRPATADPYDTPVTVDWTTYNNVWFEDHTTWGKVMMVGFPTSLIPELSSGQDVVDTAKVVVTWPDGTTNTYSSFGKDGKNCFFSIGSNTLFRVATDPFPEIYGDGSGFAPEMMAGTKIEFVRKSDSKVMFTGTVPGSSTLSGRCGNNLTWTLADNTLTISGYGEMWDYPSFHAPWEDYNYYIHSIVVEDGATSIGAGAFAYSAAEIATIPNGLASIGRNAFYNCRSLKTVSRTGAASSAGGTVGYGAFAECPRLTQVELPEGVTTLEGYFDPESGYKGVFSHDTALQSIVLPANLETIGPAAFYGCTALDGVGLPASLRSVGAYAYGGCSSLRTATYPGTRAEWKEKVTVGSGNDTLLLALFGQIGTLSLEGAAARAGEIAAVPVRLDKNPGIISITIDIAYDEGLELVGIDYLNEQGLPLFGGTDLVEWRTEMPSDNPNAFKKNPKRLSWEADLAPANITTTGVIATLYFKVPQDALPGAQYEVTPLLGDKFIDFDMNNVEFDLMPATVTVIASPVTTLVPAKAATCTEDGNIEYYEGSDGKLYLDADATRETTLEEVTIPATGHMLTHHEGVEPTCTEPGSREYWSCDFCGKLFLDETATQEIFPEDVTLPAAGHKLVRTGDKDPTCEEGGNIEYYTCEVCGKLFLDTEALWETTLEEVTLPATGHFPTHHAAVEPTCEEGGNIEYWQCEVCGKLFLDEGATRETTLEELTLPAEGHLLVKVGAKAATCEENGNIEYWQCEVCGKLFLDDTAADETTLEEVTLTATGHTLTKVEAKDATCEQAGYTEYYTCNVCGKLFLDEAATRETTLADVITPAAGHKLVRTGARAATCEENGNREYYTCEVCGKIFLDEGAAIETTIEETILPATGHTLTHHEAVEPTTTEPGNIEYWQCSVCGKVFLDEGAARESNFDDVTIPEKGPEPGDVDGTPGISSGDRTYLARALAGWEGYTLDPELADVNHDGEVNSADRTYLARALAGWEGYTLE